MAPRVEQRIVTKQIWRKGQCSFLTTFSKAFHFCKYFLSAQCGLDILGTRKRKQNRRIRSHIVFDIAATDPKIVLALPTWWIFAGYLYMRGVRKRHGSRLKWLVIAGFTIAVVNYVAVPHQFDDASSATTVETDG